MNYQKLNLGAIDARTAAGAPALGANARTSSPESNYWRRFRSPVFIKEHAPITSIHFVPASSVAPTVPAPGSDQANNALINPLIPQASSTGGSTSAAASSSQRYAVTSGTKVQLYSMRTDKVVKTVSRFGDVARSGNIRADGKLLVAGDDSGLIQVFDVNSRAILRTFKGHKLPVHVTRFSSAPTQVLSASDDQTVRLWDIPSQSAVRTFARHSDYVRSAMVSPDNPSLLLSGSYDATVRLWDARVHENGGQVIQMDHKAPVEDIAIYPTAGGGVALSVGGPVLRAWDLMMGGRCIKAISNHQKTITSLAISMESDANVSAAPGALGSIGLGSSGMRILTGGLDHLIKIYDPSKGFKVTHTMRYPAQILCMALSPDESHLAVGMADGTLCIRKRELKQSEIKRRQERKAALIGGSYDSFLQGNAAAAAQQAGSTMGPGQDAGRRSRDDVRVASVRSVKLKDYDKFLKAFRYQDALNAVLRPNVPANVTFALLLELTHRSPIVTATNGGPDGIRRAVQGRDDVGLEPLLKFLLKHASNPAYVDIVSDTMNVLIDCYADVLGQSPLLDDMLGRIWAKISDEIKLQRNITQVKGALEMILARTALSAALSQP
ncbi:WD40 repeat-like protein [Tilletiaria anomala UBC 951]|uniref:WD40 repeat-like protein n=1 Tax=Tilletiaria anomala (strain ATCC 24038 / CBS 436.72 / UBC 951) TaxID=1037660 RepID=A0A066VLG2_TILAU|nr:WD40 repeat-like protein [Tilletiaria anomala UBC 951]KDN39385.1 WD40 repeat-like protein [Tilletiaria anomala UBC 951]